MGEMVDAVARIDVARQIQRGGDPVLLRHGVDLAAVGEQVQAQVDDRRGEHPEDLGKLAIAQRLHARDQVRGIGSSVA